MKNNQKAFTLIELLIVVTIFSILTAIAVPSFQSTIKNNRIQTQLRGFSGDLKFARSEAVSTQRTVTVCHLNGSSTCDGLWSQGWTVFYDNDADGVLAATTDILKVHDALNNVSLSVVDNGATGQQFIQFNRLGVVPTAVNVKMCEDDNIASYARAIIVENSGVGIYSRINSVTNIYKDINGADLSCP